MRYLTIILLTTGVALAHQKTVTNISPHAIQRGAESTIVVEGHRLQQIEQYLAYAPGIEMVRYEAAAPRCTLVLSNVLVFLQIVSSGKRPAPRLLAYCCFPSNFDA